MATKFVVCLLIASAMAMSFDEYVRVFNKPYTTNTTEWRARARVFLANSAKIAAFNARPNRQYEKGINHFTDMTDAEFRQYLGLRGNGRAFGGMLQQQEPVFHTKVEDLPSSVDWRDKGVVTPVKNQGQCGSCWAFASTETIESYAALSVNPPRQVVLAPQQLVSCSKNPDKCGGTGGCSGSIAELAFEYVHTNGGQTLEKYIPYQARDTPCTYDKTKTPPAVSLGGFIKLAENNYTAVINALATVGPLAVNVEADTWSSYSRGIMPPSGCNERSTDIDHVVQLVGYGTEGGVGYWLIRNSWGPSWGEGGYIRLQRSTDGMPCNPDKSPGDGTACAPYPAEVTVCGTCGVLYDASYPTDVKIL